MVVHVIGVFEMISSLVVPVRGEASSAARAASHGGATHVTSASHGHAHHSSSSHGHASAASLHGVTAASASVALSSGVDGELAGSAVTFVVLFLSVIMSRTASPSGTS